jgi:hypothetical protein
MGNLQAERASYTRYRILALLTGLSLVSYLLRSNISIAAKFYDARSRA